MKLYLASGSPRRRQLLRQLALPFQALHVDVPEVRCGDESPQHYVERVSLDKARAGLAIVAQDAEAVVIAADTEVVLDDEVFGKPRDSAHAADMLRRLSGRSHLVLSALWCISATREEYMLSVSEVRFAALSDARIRAYIASGECMGKAGGYAIQGRAAGFIADLRGSYSGVMGLPLFETAQLLARFGASG